MRWGHAAVCPQCGGCCCVREEGCEYACVRVSHLLSGVRARSEVAAVGHVLVRRGVGKVCLLSEMCIHGQV